MKFVHAVAISFAVVLSSCSVKLIADFDKETMDAILDAYTSVDMFYSALLISNNRSYDEFKEDYIKLEGELSRLILRNKIRPLNEESTGIAEIIRDLFIKYRKEHRENDNYKDELLLLHRERFERLFTTMAAAESFKPVDNDELIGE
ncbi:MAG: hypothetical protein K9J16_12910 [Melioribacteraceae bacterium]|nr:hypothetical protein [Melioribacteraceae bacterium]MCF8353649.1 hypothetical protein [Melioribacteraceae bacterium]MCF8393419.1 hypothetical protein [Melioribacteraceae bacterium]MCF8419276.1 hypothetical protein [Melioribacteraceae bacterium]